jgi:hypothetical protein
MRGFTADGRRIPRGMPGGFFDLDRKSAKLLLLESTLIKRCLREQLPEVDPERYFTGRGKSELLMRSPSLFVRVGLAEQAVKEELESLKENIKRAANRALSMKQRRVHIPSDLVAAYVALTVLARLAGLSVLVRRLQELHAFMGSLELALLTSETPSSDTPHRRTPSS